MAEIVSIHDVLDGIQDQEEWEQSRIVAAYSARKGIDGEPNTEWVAEMDQKQDGLRKRYSPLCRAPELDNLRVIMIMILIFHNSILETLTSYTEDVEAEYPKQFVILSFLSGVYRTISVSLFFYVSGQASWICLVVQASSTRQFLIKKIWRTLWFSLSCYAIFLSTQYVYGPWPTELTSSGMSYYATQAGKKLMLQGPIYYVITLLLLDFCFILFRYVHRRYYRVSFIERLIGTETRFKTMDWILIVFLISYLMFVLSGIITFPARLSSFLTYVPVDAQFPFTYILAYTAAVNNGILQEVWLKTHQRRPSPHVFVISVIWALVFSFGTLAVLYRYFPPLVLQYISVKLAPHQTMEVLTPPALSMATRLFAMWTINTYSMVLKAVVSCMYTGLQWTMKKDLGILSAYMYLQTIIHMFFVIGFARHSSWTGGPIMRFLFVGSSSIFCGWIVTLVPIIAYRFFTMEDIPLEGEEKQDVAEQIRTEESKIECEKADNLESTGTELQTYSVNDVVLLERPVTDVESEETQTLKAKVREFSQQNVTIVEESKPSSSERQLTESEKQGLDVVDSSELDEDKAELQSKEVENGSEQLEPLLADNGTEGHTVTHGKKRVLILDIARTFFIMVLIFHTTIARIVENISEDGMQTTSPKLFVTLSFFKAFYQTFSIPSLYLISGVSSYICLSTDHRKTSSRFVWKRMLQLFFVAYVQMTVEWASRRFNQMSPVEGPKVVRTQRNGEKLTLFPTITYLMLLVPLDFGYWLLRTATRNSQYLTRMFMSRKRYLIIQATILFVQLIYASFTLGGHDLFKSKTWNLDAQFPLSYIVAYSVGVNISYLAPYLARSRRRIIITAILRVLALSAALSILYYRISPVRLAEYISPTTFPHRIMDSGTSTDSRVAVFLFECWSMATFILLIEGATSFLLSVDQSELLSGHPQWILLLVRNGKWYSFIHPSFVAILVYNSNRMKDLSARIFFVAMGSIVCASVVMIIVARIFAMQRIKTVSNWILENLIGRHVARIFVV